MNTRPLVIGTILAGIVAIALYFAFATPAATTTEDIQPPYPGRVYACESGSMAVTFSGDKARLAFSDGRELVIPFKRMQGNGEKYVYESQDGMFVLELHPDGVSVYESGAPDVLCF